MNYPRVLVVSNNSFSKINNNGRTLGNLFIGWPKESLAQFCVSTEGPNFDLCDNYYCITDNDVLTAFLHLKKAYGRKLKPSENTSSAGSRGEGKKTISMMLARNLIWGFNRWKNVSFMNWVRQFNPDVILLFFSDSSFLLNIASALSKELSVPLVVFNTEGYYFFKSNYMRTKTVWDWILFPIYQWQYKKQVKKTMKRVRFSMYLNQLLRTDYDNEFGGPSEVLYTSSSLEFEEHTFSIQNPTFSYIGNLTFDRPKALIEVADVLQSLNKEYILDIYGKTLDQETERLLINHPGISYKGFISYDEVKNVIHKSDVLFHAETQDKRWEESLKYGFSTKMADSISSGSCFVLYASPEIACSQYIKETGAGWFADSKEGLKIALEEILYNEEQRQTVLKTARQIASNNHSVNNNCQKFRSIICNCVNSEKE